MTRTLLLLIPAVLISSCDGEGSGVTLSVDPEQHRVEVRMDGELFTVYRFEPMLDKPVLFPVNAPGGIAVTRGYPLETVKGERADHPHHVGYWLNYGDVNGYDFWNNSRAVAPDRKVHYGRIVHREVLRAAVEKDTGILEVKMDWMAPDTDNPVRLLEEHTTFLFHRTGDVRIIDRITRLTAVTDTVVLGDNKEGLAAIRVARQLELPEERPVVLTDASGRPSDSAVVDNRGVTGHYYSSRGIEGTEVWGKRAEWVRLTGQKQGETVSIILFDHPGNPNHPPLWHARGYGLFSVNNLGQKAYRGNLPALSRVMVKGESLTLKHRMAVVRGDPQEEEINQIFSRFSQE